MINKLLENWWWIILIIGGMVFVVIKNQLNRKRKKEVEDQVSQLLSLHKKEFVFLCDFADFIDGDEAYIQMSGEANNTIKLNTRIIDSSGTEHNIRDIFVVGKDEVSETRPGEKFVLSVSCGKWTGSQFKTNFPKYSPELLELRQKIKDEKVVVFKLQ